MNREEDMAGYAQQGTADTLAISRLKLDLTILSVANGVATFTLEGQDNGSGEPCCAYPAISSSLFMVTFLLLGYPRRDAR